jgi:hypothetical protein
MRWWAMISRADFTSDEEYRAAIYVSEEEFQAEIDRLFQEVVGADNKGAILDAIHWCLVNDRPVPGWAVAKFSDAYSAVIWHHHKSWDDVFGRPVKKGAQLAALRLKKRKGSSIAWKVRERHAAGVSITKELFDAIGAEEGVSGTVAAEIYYAFVRQFPEFNSGKI